MIPAIEGLSSRFDVPVSVDTSKPGVMQQAVVAGASMINDVRALREEGALGAAAGCGVPVCLMHMQGEPRTMQEQPVYDDVVADVRQFLSESIIMSFIALIIALILAEFIIPVFNDFTGKAISMYTLFEPQNIILIVVLGILIGILSGLYPAFYLSRFNPIVVLKSSLKHSY